MKKLEILKNIINNKYYDEDEREKEFFEIECEHKILISKYCDKC